MTEVELRRTSYGQLSALVAGSWVPVRIARCFPWTSGEQWYSLRNSKDEEIFLVRRISELGAESRRALESSLTESGFLFEVVGIDEQAEEYELRRWTVRTTQGMRTFLTGVDEWPRRLPEGGLLFRDVSGDLYRIQNPLALDAASRKRIWAFLD